MRLLLDTNIFLEVLLGQEKSGDVKRLLGRSDHELYMTDFSLHSIGVLLFRKKQIDVFTDFVLNIVSGAGAELLSLPTSELQSLSANAERFRLDFDDAYQYSVSKKYGLTVVSFDSDFDRTDSKRKTPFELL